MNSNQNENNLVVSKSDNSYELLVPLNENIMDKMRDESISATGKDPFKNKNSIVGPDTKINLDLNIQEIDNDLLISVAKGKILYSNKTFKFEGSGLFFKFISPDNDKTYYYTDLKDEQNNTIFLIVFSLEDNKAFIQSTDIMKIEDFEGYLAFGESFMNKNYWDQIYKEMERLGL